MQLTLDQLKLAIKSPFVRRAMIHPIIPQISIAEHMFRVAALYDYLGGTELIATLTHDIEETLTGDIPSPAKKHLQGLDYFENMRPAYTDPAEKRLAKLCDKLDLVLQIKPYVGFGEDVLRIYQDEVEMLLDIAKELNKTKEVKRLLKELN